MFWKYMITTWVGAFFRMSMKEMQVLFARSLSMYLDRKGSGDKKCLRVRICGEEIPPKEVHDLALIEGQYLWLGVRR